MAATKGRILVGTCNWADHRHFYPERMPAADRLAYYARFFPMVEADTTFYGVPKPGVADRWIEATPEDFIFNVKAHRSLTWHERVDGRARPPEDDEVLEFMDFLEPMRASGKLRAVHYQFPPWFTARPANMDYIASLRDRHPDDQLVIEMRHASWGAEERFEALRELLEEARMTYCIVDQPQLGSGSMPAHLAVTDLRLSVIRMHGRNYKTWYKNGKTSDVRFDYLYREEELEQWVPRIRDIARDTEEVHVLFNNNRSNYAVANGLQLARLLELGLPAPEEAGPVIVEAEQDELPLG